jgi:hypothetical protein
MAIEKHLSRSGRSSRASSNRSTIRAPKTRKKLAEEIGQQLRRQQFDNNLEELIERELEHRPGEN